MTRCPKCNYVRTAQDANPEWQCPSCGVAYNKAADQMGAVKHSSTTGFTAARESAPGLFRRLLSTPVLLLLALGLGVYGYVGYSGKHSAQAQASVKEAEEQVVLYSTSQCPNCRQVKAYFKANKIAYTEYNVEESMEYRRKFYAIGGKGVPLLFVKGERMDGFDQAHFEQLYR